MANSKQIVYLSQAQYAELIANGSITVDGVTVQYDENDIYVTPQAEPVTDVRVAGTSVATNGVADIPIANTFRYGVVRTDADYGTQNLNDRIAIQRAADDQCKIGVQQYRPIVTCNQHLAAFYGLAKAAGHDEASSTEPLGTYTPEAKGAIQSMLGVSDLIATAENNLVASKAYKVGDVFTANGKLYKATAAIAADVAIIPAVEGEEIAGANCTETNISENFIKNTDYASETSNGVVRVKDSYGVGTILSYNINTGVTEKYTGIISASSDKIKNGTELYNPIIPYRQHESVFYGLAKAAGDTTQKASENAVGSYTDEAKSAIKSMIGVNVEDVQVNGTSVVSDGVANIAVAQANVLGVVKAPGTYGVSVFGGGSAGTLALNPASADQIKAGNSTYNPIGPANVAPAAFYGLAKASGDTTQSSSSNAVGTYTDNAKASIKAMLGIQDGSTGTVDVSGTTPTITAVENTRYVCGEVTSLSFTPPASGISIVRFTSGSTVTVLTIPSTVKFPEWFDPTSLETNTIYEICVTDGEFGAVMSWPL